VINKTVDVDSLQIFCVSFGMRFMILLFLFSCTKTISNDMLSNPNYSVNIDLENNEIAIFPIGHFIPDNYGIIEEVFIGPHGTKSCSYESVLFRVQEKTKELKGNAFKVTDIKYPNSGNPCYTITALILKSNK